MLRDEEKPFLDHLEDLRRIILAVGAALGLGMLVAIPAAPRALAWLQRPLQAVVKNPEAALRSITVTGGIAVGMQLIFWIGILFSAPLAAVIVTAYLLPALTRRERRTYLIGGVVGMLLFAFGVGFAYYATLPMALRVMQGVNTWLGIATDWTANSYATFCIHLLVAFGLVFEMPMLVMVLGWMGIVSSAQMRNKRRHVIVGILILAMVLTPGPDFVSQVVLAIPMIILYELCIWATWLSERRRRRGAGETREQSGKAQV